MSEKIDNNSVHFSGAYSYKKAGKKEDTAPSIPPEQTTTRDKLGEGALGRSLVKMSKINFTGTAPSTDMIEDVRYFQKNSEAVGFYNNIADHAISKGTPYFEGLKKAQACLDALHSKE